MTEKRFNVFDIDGTIFLEDHKKGSYHIGETKNVDVNCLNDLADRLNEQLRKEVEFWKQLANPYSMNHCKKLEEDLDYYKTKCSSLETGLFEADREKVKLKKENKELQQRNNRQAERLDNLYNLIEQKDWKALTDIINDFKKVEEQLQKEMRCYND